MSPTANARPGALNLQLHPRNTYTIACTFPTSQAGKTFQAQIVGLTPIAATVATTVVTFTVPSIAEDARRAGFQLVDITGAPVTVLGGRVDWFVGYTDTPSSLAVTVLTSPSVNVAVTVLPGGGGGGGASGVAVSDEGAQVVAAATTLNFVGAGVAATASGATATVTIPDGGAGKLTAASNLSDVANAATARTNLGLGTAATQASGAFDTAGAAAAAQAASQPLDSDLTAIASLTTTAFGRSVLDRADAAALRTLAGSTIGTNVQAWDADLDTIAARSGSPLHVARINAGGTGLEFAAPAAGKVSPLTIMGVGDSITAHTQDTGILGGTFQTGRSFLMWAQMLSGGKLRFTGISALGGQTAAQILTRDVPNVAAATVKPDYCTVLAGYNDIIISGAGGLPAAYTGITGITDALLAAGITPILCTLPGYGTALANVALLEHVNVFVRRLAQQRRVPLADFQTVCSDPDTDPTVNTTQGTWRTGLLAQAASDYVHPSTAGQKAMGAHLAAILNLGTATDIDLPMYNSDNLNKIANGNNLVDVGGDGVPDGWNLLLAGTGLTKTIVADTAIPGSWWRVVKTANDDTQYDQSYSGVTVGQILRLCFRLRINSITSTGFLRVALYNSANGSMADPNVVPQSAAQISAGQATTLQSAFHIDIGGPDGAAVTGEGPMVVEGVATSTSGSVRVTFHGPCDVQVAQMRLLVFNADGTPA